MATAHAALRCLHLSLRYRRKWQQLCFVRNKSRPDQEQVSRDSVQDSTSVMQVTLGWRSKTQPLHGCLQTLENGVTLRPSCAANACGRLYKDTRDGSKGC